VVEKANGNYGAYAPDVPGCIAVGKTVEETLRSFREALEFHFEGMAASGEPIPQPSHVEAHFVEVSVPPVLPPGEKSSNPMMQAVQFTHQGIGDAGFEGFVTFGELRGDAINDIPECGGVYVVLYEGEHRPNFLDASVGGWFKGKNPSVDKNLLVKKWVDGTNVVYIGKASSTVGLRKRLKQYRDFGDGRRVGHKGGRYIWQIEGCDDLIVAWKCATEVTAEQLEAQLQNEFCDLYGQLPFANLKKETLV
jgi:predicted RNase H-like HicB family nuclease